jgi:hypothetical protein
MDIKLACNNTIYYGDCYGESYCYNCDCQNFICESCENMEICGHCYYCYILFKICPSCKRETKIKEPSRICDWCATELVTDDELCLIHYICTCCDNLLCVECICQCINQQSFQCTNDSFYCFDCQRI